MKHTIATSRRHAATLAGLALTIVTAAPALGQLSSGLISQQQAASLGLKRAWYARVELDPSRTKVVDWILSDDQLLIVTDSGVLHALDANTGQTQWVTQFGNPDYPSIGPDANDEFVAVINGSTLYLLDRASGRIRQQRSIGGAPGAGPALGKDYVFVPTMDGLIEGYPLDANAPQYRRWFYQSIGKALVSPLVTPDSVAWTTDKGYLYVSGSVKPGVRFRLETSDEFDARPAYRAPLIYAVALSGEMFAVDELTGALQWRYITGYPNSRAPAAVAERLFVTSEEPMLHCVDASTGIPQWRSPGLSQFAAVSQSHVYGIDRYGSLHVLNVVDGAPVGRITTGASVTALVNDQTDRLYLISEKGLVQCLHEIGANKPTYYARPQAAAAKPTQPSEQAAKEPSATRPDTAPTESAQPSETGSGEAAPATEVNPFGTEDENPFD